MKKWLLLGNKPISRLEYKKLNPIYDQNGQNGDPIYDRKGCKTIPFGVTHAYIAHVSRYPPSPEHIPGSDQIANVPP